jgi:hypothetical protein
MNYLYGFLSGLPWGLILGAFVLRPWLERVSLRMGSAMAARIVAEREGCTETEAKQRIEAAQRGTFPKDAPSAARRTSD